MKSIDLWSSSAPPSVEDSITIQDATELAKVNYTEYSKYVAQGRAYPNLLDGAKSAYKRAIYGMYLNKTNKTVKVAELAAHALPFHPHPTSISGVIVQLGDRGNKLKLMDTQGNWGNSARNIAPAAERYIGGKLSTLAEHLLCDSIEYAEQITGEIDKPEPKALPAYLPLCFINGSSGIPSGLPTLNIPTVDILGMVDYYIEILKSKDLKYVPKKFPKPNLEVNVVSPLSDWNTIMLTGKGTIKTAPIMEIDDKGVITITSLPKSKTIDHIRKIVEKEILLDKIDLRDETTDRIRVVIEKVPYKQCDMQELFKRLYSKLQSSETYNMAFFDADRIYVPCSFNKVVRSNLQFVIDTHKTRIKRELAQQNIRLKVLQIIEDMKQKNSLKSLFSLTDGEAVNHICKTYKVVEEVAKKVLQKPISYLTKEHHQEILDLQEVIRSLENDDEDIYEFLVRKYQTLRKELAVAIKDSFIPTKFVK